MILGKNNKVYIIVPANAMHSQLMGQASFVPVLRKN